MDDLYVFVGLNFLFCYVVFARLFDGTISPKKLQNIKGRRPL